VNWEHLGAIVWLRQRMFLNSLRRSGIANTIVTSIIIGVALLGSIVALVVSLVAGIYLLPKASPDQILILWTVLTGVFLISWTIGLMTELQRSEVLSFQKLLYYPISLFGTFLVNYVSSLVSVTLILFVPAMFGLCVASVVALGPRYLVLFPLLFGLVSMVTAVSYHLRGWLAALMVNKRRRRTLVTVITLSFVLLSQLPQIIPRLFLRSETARNQASVSESNRYTKDYAKLQQQLGSRQITPLEYQKRVAALNQDHEAKINVESQRQQAAIEARFADAVRWLRAIDLVVPPGWMAYGAMSAAGRQIAPGLLGALGMCLIAAASLRRSYHTTLRYYRGEYESGETGRKRAPARPTGTRATLLVERQLPRVPEQAAATALANLRSLLRAPEAKMMLFSVLIVAAIFGMSLVAGSRSKIPAAFRPLLAMGVIMMVSLGLSQIFQNQFGFDRDGFRTLILSPARRQEILLGKNLSLAPFMLGIGATALVVFEFVAPLPVTHFLAALVQLVTAYLIVCVMGNFTSILLPSAVRAGTFRSSKTTFTYGLLRIVATVALSGALGLLFIPLGIDLAVSNLGYAKFVPIDLILAILELAAVSVLYWLLLESQGQLFQSREQKILAAVTAKND
jgi:ABC-2 type transport system permease protein